MNPLIEACLRRFRRRLRGLVGLHGLAWLVVVSLSVVMASGLADWLLDLPAGVRAILLAGLVAGTLAAAYRYLLVPLVFPLRDLDLAQRIEARYPGLQERLASAVQFLGEPAESSRSGSPAMKRAVIQEAGRYLQAIDAQAALDPGPVRRMTMAAAAVLVVALSVVAVSPANARIALARLVRPFDPVSWPRQTHLELVDTPQRVARGEPFPVTVQVVKGPVPDRAQVYYLFESGETLEEPLRPHGNRRFVGGLQATTQSFDFYVRAGDGLTDSRHVRVVPPPYLERFRIRLTYPAYTGKAAEELPAGQGHIRAVWGTRVELAGRASKPLAAAELHLPPDRSLPVQLDASGRQLHAAFSLQTDGSYWFVLHDRDGFQNTRATRYRLQAVTDQPPVVSVEHPPADLEVTPSAQVPLRVALKDDFGLQDLELHYGRSQDQSTTDSTVPLWSATKPTRRHQVEYVWALADLHLAPGASLNYYFTARDTDNLRGPNVGTSRRLRLLVVSGEELLRSLENRQQLVFQELERIRKLQLEGRWRVNEQLEQWRASKTLTKTDVTQMQSVEVLQRQVQRRVASPTEGLQREVKRILDDLASNRIQRSDLAKQMQQINQGLERIAGQELPAIEQRLTRSRKRAEQAVAQAQSQLDQLPDLPKDMAQVRDHQDAVLGILESLIERLGKWQTYRDIARDARDLLEGQQDVAGQTKQTGSKTIGQPVQSLPPQTRGELARIAGRQQQLHEQLGRLERKMDRLSRQLTETDPVGADTLRDTADLLRHANTAERMRNAARAIRQNQVGRAQTAQQQAIDDLKQVLEALENSQERDLARIVEKLRAAQKELAQIRQRQAAQLQRTRQAAEQADLQQRRRLLQQLARQQRELERQTARLARQLRRYQARSAGGSAASAAGRMGQAGGQLQQGQADQAGRQQQRVLEDLKQAQQQLDQALKEAEAALANEQLARISDTLASLLQRQKELKGQTAELDQAVARRGRWSRPQLASLRAAASAQEAIREDTDQTGELLTAAPVFQLVLRRAAGNMQRAVTGLQARQTGSQTQAAQQAAADRIAQLLQALKQDQAEAQQDQQQGGGGGGGGGQGGQQARAGIPPLAQLKLLRSLQVEINQRTEQLAQSRRNQDGLTDAEEAELKSLAAEQGTLADLVHNLLQPVKDGD